MPDIKIPQLAIRIKMRGLLDYPDTFRYIDYSLFAIITNLLMHGSHRHLLLLLLAFGWTVSARGQDFWLPVSSPTTNNLRALCFTDSLYGWATGSAGTIIRTTDGGRAWTLLDPAIANDIVDIFMLNRMEGWALAYKTGDTSLWTLVLATTDGGESWTSSTFPRPDVILNSIHWFDNQHAWATGERATLVRTIDGGRTWTDAVLDSSPPPLGDLRQIRFMSPFYGYAVGGRFDLTGVVWRTSDGGETWTAHVVAPEPVNDVHFIDSLNVIGVTGDYDYGSGMVRTTDGGITWQYTYLGIWGDARALAFRTPEEGWAVLGFAGTCMVTRDTGWTWQSFHTPETTSVYDIQFVTPRRGIMVGSEGKIFRFDPDAVAVRENGTLPTRHRLFPPYPNPFNPSTQIDFELGSHSHVRLEVYDLTGRKIATLVDGMRDPGLYHVVFSAKGGSPPEADEPLAHASGGEASHIASGVYIARLLVSDHSSAFSAVTKLLLMR